MEPPWLTRVEWPLHMVNEYRVATQVVEDC
jgi:hypothetical protein